MAYSELFPYAFGILRRRDIKPVLEISGSDIPIEEYHNLIEFIVSAHNECIKVNKNNPMAVSDNIVNAINLLEKVSSGYLTPELRGDIIKVLGDINNGKDGTR
jgi:hypothetical protein